MKESTKVINEVMNDALNAMLKKHPDEDAVTIMQKSVFESYDRLAFLFDWSEKQKQEALDRYFDIFKAVSNEEDIPDLD